MVNPMSHKGFVNFEAALILRTRVLRGFSKVEGCHLDAL
jgi:hypothetical protein